MVRYPPASGDRVQIRGSASFFRVKSRSCRPFLAFSHARFNSWRQATAGHSLAPGAQRMASRFSSFLAELKRRKVYHVAVAYILVGWGVSQGAEFLFGDVLRLQDVVWQVVIGLIVLGFPIALVLAWAYELRPEEPRKVEQGTEGILEPSTVGDRKSIVVLPFDNMSPDPGDAYFSDGLTEEIITSLSRISSLRVISRSSAMVLKGTQKEVRTIGRELDVQYVLEGSVRKAGNDLRITAQLIDAASDEHLWADRYDGILEDVFGMQEDVSRSIVDALRLKLGPDEERRVTERPIDNLQAYECYLRARYEFWTWGGGSLDRSMDLIERGLEVVGDNDLLQAWKGMILHNRVNSLLGSPDTYEDLLKQARECGERALASNPDSAPGHTLLGYVLVNSGHPTGAVQHFAEALRLDPDNPEALLYLGFMAAVGGWDLQGSRRLFERAAAVDPLTTSTRGALAWLYWMEGDFSEMLEGFREMTTETEKSKSPWRAYFAYLHALGGQFDEAERLVDQQVADSPDHILTSLGKFLKSAWKGEKKQALEAVKEDLEKGAWWDDMWPLLMADAYALIEEDERALLWLDHAIDFGMTNTRFLGEYDPFLENLRSDHRFGKLMQKAQDLSESFSALVNIGELV